MPNPTLTRAIDALASRRDLSADETAEVLAEIMHGEVSETQIAGFLIALRTKGETVDELTGLARTMRELAAHVPTDARRPARHGRHRRRAAHVQRLHHRRADRRRRGLRRGQARQPLGHERVGLGRSAGGARRAHRPRPRGRRALHRGGRLRLHVRARASPGDALRRARAPRARRAHDLQPARSADQSGRRAAPGDRRLRRGASSTRSPARSRGSASIARWSSRPRTGSTSCRSSPRRKSSRSTARRSPATRSRPPTSASSRSPPTCSSATAPAARPSTTRPSRARSSPATACGAGLGGDRAGGHQRRRGDLRRRARPTRSPTACRRRARRSPTARAAQALERYVRASRAHAPARGRARERAARPSVLARILAEHARGARAAQARGAAGRARRARVSPRRARRRARLRARADARPGIAVIAEFKRRSPSAGALRDGADLARDRRRLRARRRRARCRCSPRARTSAARSTTCAPRARCCELPILRKDFVVDEYQLLEARAAGADAVLLIVAALDDDELARLHDAARALGPRRARRGSRPRTRSSARSRSGARLIGVNNRDLRDFSVDVARTTQLLRARFPRASPSSRSPASPAPSSCAASQREGVDAVLVGEALMRAADPARALRELLGERQAAAAASRRRGRRVRNCKTARRAVLTSRWLAFIQPSSVALILLCNETHVRHSLHRGPARRRRRRRRDRRARRPRRQRASR